MAAARANNRSRTAERILDIAERLVQTRGFNAFSYGDIARELGITTASLHYHFPGKAELGEALIKRYAQRFSGALGRIDEEMPEAVAKLRAYAGLYAEELAGKRMCMCGILAAEYQTLPEAMRGEVIRFFDDHQRWLAGVLAQGQSQGKLRLAGSLEEIAEGIISTLEGAMLIALPYGDTARFDSTTSRLLAALRA